MKGVIETSRLGKRYGKSWGLRGCSVSIPAQRVTALVGPNGAGKTTLLQLIVGLLVPTEGDLEVLGRRPLKHPLEVLPRLGFVAQDHPLYSSLTVSDHLDLGRRLNSVWDDSGARERLREIGMPLGRRAGRLSGGQQAQLALTLALAKRPDIVILDEPLASLDPLARHDFLGLLMETVAQQRLTVVLSSHVITDLERVCDFVILLLDSQVELSGAVEDILQNHRVLTGPLGQWSSIAGVGAVIDVAESERQVSLVARIDHSLIDPRWVSSEMSLEQIALAYMSGARRRARELAKTEVAHR